jgi:hypothetical protein
MPALVAGIDVFLTVHHEPDVDGRNESGQDVEGLLFQELAAASLSPAVIRLSSR